MLPSNAGRSPLVNKPAPLVHNRARKAGFAREIFAPAKLNLYLEVLGARADGFHDLETLMVPVRVYDQICWRENAPPASADCLTLQIRSLLPADGKAKRSSGGQPAIGELRTVGDQQQGDQQQGDQLRADQLLGEVSENLVLRAARLLAKTAGIAPHGRFDLIKRIPIQAGMGGGSSDAAAALVLANEVWGIGYARQQLLPLAAELGSDVPFFMNRYFASPGAAICRGRGELIEPVARLPRLQFVVMKPTAGLSTAEVFRNLPQRTETGETLAKASHARLSRIIDSLQNGNIAAAAEAMTNRLEFASARLAPWLEEWRRVFTKLGCWGHFLTGSGSAYVGVMRSATQARNVARRLANTSNREGMSLENVFATSNC